MLTPDQTLLSRELHEVVKNRVVSSPQQLLQYAQERIEQNLAAHEMDIAQAETLVVELMQHKRYLQSLVDEFAKARRLLEGM